MTNYTYHMGTPALAALAIAKYCWSEHCGDCPLNLADVNCSDYQEVREWLESEVD